MEDGAASLCNRVLPPVPLRQWVLSLPKALRYLLAYNGQLCRTVAASAMRVNFHYLRQKAKRQTGLRSTRLAHPGAMVAVQRVTRPPASGFRPRNRLRRFGPILPPLRFGRMVGSALNLNIHFYALVLDRVYVLDAFGSPNFFELL